MRDLKQEPKSDYVPRKQWISIRNMIREINLMRFALLTGAVLEETGTAAAAPYLMSGILNYCKSMNLDLARATQIGDDVQLVMNDSAIQSLRDKLWLTHESSHVEAFINRSKKVDADTATYLRAWHK